MTEYVVNVGNIGNVTCADMEEAQRLFDMYVEQSKADIGRAGGEDVYLLVDGDIVREYIGDLPDDDEDLDGEVELFAGTCECADPGCPACNGKCANQGDVILYRIDMEDDTGTFFCEECAADALECGLFTDKLAPEWDEDEDEDGEDPGDVWADGLDEDNCYSVTAAEDTILFDATSRTTGYYWLAELAEDCRLNAAEALPHLGNGAEVGPYHEKDEALTAAMAAALRVMAEQHPGVPVTVDPRLLPLVGLRAPTDYVEPDGSREEV